MMSVNAMGILSDYIAKAMPIESSGFRRARRRNLLVLKQKMN
jgi:hypothetical protein